jgi:hypothetical protein
MPATQIATFILFVADRSGLVIAAKVIRNTIAVIVTKPGTRKKLLKNGRASNTITPLSIKSLRTTFQSSEECAWFAS